MRVNSVNPSDLFRQYVVRPKMAVEQTESVSDKTELTEGARTFSTALKAAQESMETRTPGELSHINNVTEQIRNNTYFVPGYAVAQKILSKQD